MKTLSIQIHEFEKQIFRKSIRENGWARGATCKHLGISPGKFARLMDDCGMAAEYKLRGRRAGGNQRVLWEPK